MGDFYPLTPYSLDESVWMAWQFDIPENGEGVVQAFRRPQSPDDTATYRLRGLEANAVYELTSLDRGEERRAKGRELMQQGLQVTAKQKPWAAIVLYRKVPGSTHSSGRHAR